MNRETELEIWNRVRGPGLLNAEQALLPERLEQAILDQKQNAAELRQLSRRFGGRDGGRLSRMAAQNDAGARELTALHYLLTGRRLRLMPKSEPLPRDLPEALRQACLRQQQAAKSFAALGREFSEWADTFSRMERAARSRFEDLSRLMEAQLR